MASSSRSVAPPSISSARASTPSMRCWYCGTLLVRKPGGRERRASALVIVCLVIGFVVGKGFERFLAVARQQHFDLLLRRAQCRLALPRQGHAALEGLERFFERHIALLEFGHQCFELGQ